VCAIKNVECTASEYEVSGPTTAKPRVCAAITPCTDMEYQTATPTVTR
jgi:hypothetical protein